MYQLETIATICILILFFVDGASPQPVTLTGYQTLGFLSISNSSIQYLNHELDGASDPTYIPYGFAFGNETFSKAYVGTNGLISFGKSFHLWHPHQFPSNDPLINSANILAPYWSDNDIRDSGEISYASFQYSPGNTEGNSFLGYVSSYIRIFYPNASLFQGNFIIIAEWDQVHPFPHGSSNVADILSSNPSIRDFIEMTNTYQAIAITDGTDSYAVFTYDCNLLQWTGLWNQPVIGFNAAAGSLYSNHPYSFLSNTNEIACISNNGPNLTSVIFKITSTPSPIQSGRQSCWRWYFNDLRYGSLDFYYQFAPSCPCTVFQADFDLRWDFLYQNSIQICYISKIQYAGVGQLCCYYRASAIAGAPLVNGRYSGGFLLFHPFAHNSDTDFAAKDLCCSVGLCNLFQQRRPLQTCEGYRLQMLGWAWGDPHFTTMDGMTYTFNGLGEYILMRIELINFEIQGKATKLVNESDATFLTALAIGRRNTDDIVQFTVSDNASVSVTLKNESATPNFIVRQTMPDDATIIFRNDIGVTVQLHAGYLNLHIRLPPIYMGYTLGLLGNSNGDISDDFIFRNGTILNASASDREIHQFSQSWQLQVNDESLFFYDDDNNISTYAVAEHEPPFLDEITEELLANAQLTDICGNSLQCLFDYNQTGDPSIGLFATNFQQGANDIKILYCTCLWNIRQ